MAPQQPFQATEATAAMSPVKAQAMAAVAMALNLTGGSHTLLSLLCRAPTRVIIAVMPTITL